jgi:hypothetical protein
MATGCDTRQPPHDSHFDDLPPCVNCGEWFEEHMQDGEPLYMCPPEHQRGSVYGFFSGGDPRDFHPDYEDCSPDEIRAWQQAVREADRLSEKRELPCPSGFERTADGTVIHVLRAPFGIGVTTFPPTCYERA